MAACDIDDLIAAFSSTTHISQEAMDLQTLQSQLSNTLTQFHHAPAAPCPTTPTMSTMELAPLPTNPAGQSYTTQEQMDEDDMRMVEESLFGGQQRVEQVKQPQQQPHQQQQQFAYQAQLQPQYIAPTQYNSAELAAYAAMDPFFAAQLKAAQNQTTYYGQIQPGFGFAARQQTMVAPSY